MEDNDFLEFINFLFISFSFLWCVNYWAHCNVTFYTIMTLCREWLCHVLAMIVSDVIWESFQYSGLIYESMFYSCIYFWKLRNKLERYILCLWYLTSGFCLVWITLYVHYQCINTTLSFPSLQAEHWSCACIGWLAPDVPVESTNPTNKHTHNMNCHIRSRFGQWNKLQQQKTLAWF